MEDQDKYIEALIELHDGLERLGPGDSGFSRSIIGQLPGLPATPRIADLGCGTGAGALLLAEEFHSRIRAVDFSRQFLDQLMERARQRGLENFIEAIECDIGRLDWNPATVDLLWSEAAAYSLTFAGALAAWRPLMPVGGIAVISEMTCLSAVISDVLTRDMKNFYPAIKTESSNVALINASGFETLGVQRLPARAWWDNYYDPLRQRVEALANSDDQVLRQVIAATKAEMDFFEAHEQEIGYIYYIMRAV